MRRGRRRPVRRRRRHGVTEEDARVAERAPPARGRPVLLVANKVDDASRETDDLGVRWRSASATRARSAPCTAGAPATCSTLVVELLPPPDEDDGATTRRPDADADRRRRRAGRSRWPSSAGPTWASRRCSTGSSATSGPSSTTCRAPPATPSTPSSRPTTGPIRFIDTAGMRRRSQDRRGHRVLLAGAGPAGRRPGRRRPARHRRHRGRHRTRTSAWPSGSTPPAARSSCCSTSGSCSTPSSGPTSADQVGRQAALRRRRPGAQDQRPDRQGRAQAAARAGRQRSTRTTGGSRPGRSTRSSATAQAAQPAPDGARVLYATQGAADPPTFTLFANRELPPHLPALPRAPAPRGLRPGRHAGQAAGAPARSSDSSVTAGTFGRVRSSIGAHMKPILAVVAVACAGRRRRLGPLAPATCACVEAGRGTSPAPTTTSRRWPARRSARTSTPPFLYARAGRRRRRAVVAGRRRIAGLLFAARPRARRRCRVRLRARLRPRGPPVRGAARRSSGGPRRCSARRSWPRGGGPRGWRPRTCPTSPASRSAASTSPARA